MRARGLTIALALVVAAPSLAWAGDKRAAAAHFREGRTLYDAGRFDDALAAFEAGYEAFPLRGFLVNIGQCQRKLDRLDDAAASYEKFLDGAGDEKLRAEVSEALAEVRTELERRAAEADTRRKQAQDAERRALVESISTGMSLGTASRQAPRLAPLASPIARDQAAAPSPALRMAAPVENEVRAEPRRKKSRAWLWTIVGVVAAGAVAGGIAAAVIYTQPSSVHAGSLGLIDGRR